MVTCFDGLDCVISKVAIVVVRRRRIQAQLDGALAGPSIGVVLAWPPAWK